MGSLKESQLIIQTAHRSLFENKLEKFLKVLCVLFAAILIASICYQVIRPDQIGALPNLPSQIDSSSEALWVQKIAPTRQFYVLPGANGSGSSSTNPMGLDTATNRAQPGDWYWLLPGNYMGEIELFRNGTAARPIVFRAALGQHVIINGSFLVTGSYNWVWGFEITDPGRLSGQDSGVRMLAKGVRVINNVIHHVRDKNGIGAWNVGPGQVVYGNIVYQNGQGEHHPHNIYMQNDFYRYGYKYIVNNAFMDSAMVCPNCFNVHGYTTDGFVSGFNFRNNIVKNGRFLIGGYNKPADREVVMNNYFYRSRAQFGYRRPTQARFTNNYLARTSLDLGWFWGNGEVQFRQAVPNFYAENEILLPPGVHIRFTTSAYLTSGRCEGCSGIRPSDVFDRNRYSNPFHAFFFADNKKRGRLDLTQWRNATAEAGNRFDVHSVGVTPPRTPKIVLIPNQYEPSRAHLLIINWGRRPSVTVNLSPFVSAGTSFGLYDAKNSFGAPLFSGTYTGPFPVATGNQEFVLFVVKRQS